MRYVPRCSEKALALRVRERIADGRLPVVLSRKLAAGYGSGHTCRVCDRPILRQHVEYEVNDAGDGGQLTLHRSCYVIWQVECARRMIRLNA